jgi:simple sugar transport system ATP-binding protein
MSATGTPILRARAIEKRYGHVHALRGADLDVWPGEIHALLGDNGAGKSTLVKALSGVITPDSGTIEMEGSELTLPTPQAAHDAGIETVYQDLALAGTLDAGENVFLGREVDSSGLLGKLGFVDRTTMRRRAGAELEALGVKLPSLQAPVETLSGGQRQAVAIARAAIWGRRLLIMDEPTAALGPHQRAFVIDLMRRVRDERGLTILWISHNLPEVLETADRVTVLRLGARVLEQPASSVTAEHLMRAMAGVQATAEGSE